MPEASDYRKTASGEAENARSPAETARGADHIVHNTTEIIKAEYSGSEILAVPERTLKELGIDLGSNAPDFSNMGEIGRGGTALVMGATDAALGRLVAVKLLRPEYRFSREHIERIVREARATAQLEHPNIVPMHSLGVDKKYGVYFTMKKQQGDTLRNIIRQLRDGNPEYVQEYPWTKMLAIYLKTCQGVSYAHSKGVIHRDLKPENILVGKYGEVTIIDWGLVRKMKPLKTSVDISDDGEFTLQSSNVEEEIEFAAKGLQSNLTLDDFINGTPRYMAPEQAVGWNSKLDHRCDVYAMGVILYEILTFHNPFDQYKAESEVLNAVTSGAYPNPRQTRPNGKNISAELEAICLKAMALELEERYQSITDLIHDIYNYQSEREISAYKAPWHANVLKWAKRNPIKTTFMLSTCIAVLASLVSILVLDQLSYTKNIHRVQELREEGQTCLLQLGKMLDERSALLQTSSSFSSLAGRESVVNIKIEEKEAELINIYDQAYLLLNGLSYISQKRGMVIAAKQQIIVERLQFAKQYQRIAEINRWILMAKNEFGSKFELCAPTMRDFLKDMEKYHRGDCQLHIVSQPFGAEIEFFPILQDPLDNCLRPDSEAIKMPMMSRRAGTYPLPKGNYLLKFFLPDRGVVLYPLYLQHGETLELFVPIPKDIPPGMVFVPGGRCLLGGRTSQSTQYRNASLPGFFILEREVTFAEYLQFWNSLEDDADRARHRSMLSLSADSPAALPAWSSEGILIEGIEPDSPVVGINAESAMAYCQWLSTKNGGNYRLPSADEWEKAARGVDGRLFPWGNYFDPALAYTKENLAATQKHPRFASAKQFPLDQSIYGVYDMAGNVREWTASLFSDGSGLYQIKGASAVSSRRYLPLGSADDKPFSPSDVGFRYVMSFELDSRALEEPEENPLQDEEFSDSPD
ncbi:MAG: bifunctional serine/threonine-protein kinase/formylglycine-generating enzyme family protein [Lentisphaeria bacterium]|nr:bifunctional serine/threonine-protein kinase/formylglycine-generating enzyme family protein [Lentisphaeria bacterium]NLZ59934.1 SUMF1/EgtB/PvdO family nonheme iron enzyme [Lentisphaerota bacterium]